MTKNELVIKAYQDLKGTGCSIAEVERHTEAILKAIKQSLLEKETINIRGFGTFSIITRKGKTVRNISAGTSFSIPDRKMPVFKFGGSFKKKALKHLNPQSLVV